MATPASNQPQNQLANQSPTTTQPPPDSTTIPALRSQPEFLVTGIIPVPTQPDSECTICTESLSQDVIRLLACNHFFHTTCILAWFQSYSLNSGTCPNCRRELYDALAPPAEYAYDSDSSDHIHELDSEGEIIPDPLIPEPNYLYDREFPPLPRLPRESEIENDLPATTREDISLSVRPSTVACHILRNGGPIVEETITELWTLRLPVAALDDAASTGGSDEYVDEGQVRAGIRQAANALRRRVERLARRNRAAPVDDDVGRAARAAGF